uniref:Uncharacterized protein n=1 Tax=Oryza barthii TaxID=65489 RepID=A0A0D3HFQ0_9ORYZ
MEDKGDPPSKLDGSEKSPLQEIQSAKPAVILTASLAAAGDLASSLAAAGDLASALAATGRPRL